ncbi:hypothetical protein Hanom_Chr17g01570021 [Helianthus anomalus]
MLGWGGRFGVEMARYYWLEIKKKHKTTPFKALQATRASCLTGSVMYPRLGPSTVNKCLF